METILFWLWNKENKRLKMQKQKYMGRRGDTYACNKTQFCWQLAVSACYGWPWPAWQRMMLYTDMWPTDDSKTSAERTASLLPRRTNKCGSLCWKTSIDRVNNKYTSIILCHQIKKSMLSCTIVINAVLYTKSLYVFITKMYTTCRIIKNIKTR